MDLIKITDLTNQLGISSRSLRYYEQVGLIQSVRSDFEKYRSYDGKNIERLKQIMVLRKMQIPIKDILRIYANEDMSTVVEVFVERINTINDEVNALSELKHIVSDFLQIMIRNGITKISAIPLLYEEMDRQLEVLEENKPVSLEDLSSVSRKLAKPLEPAIFSLPVMRVVSSFLKESPEESDTDGFWRWVQVQKPFYDTPGQHERFEYRHESGDVIIQRVPDDFENNSEYLDFTFGGGMFAAVNVYLDEDLGERFHSLIKYFDDNKFYQVDYYNGGNMRHPALLENLISPDDKRELASLYVPVKKRLADPALFEPPEEITDISLAEIESANPVLWEVDVPLDKLTPINNPHYRMTEDGEVEYIGWVLTRVLNTNVKVKLPFRVDIEFRSGDDSNIRYGATGSNFRIYYGSHGLDHNFPFGVDMGNNEAIQFHQPIFRDIFSFAGRGRILTGEYNRLSWIIGEKHLACIINEEVRYCGKNFAYMSLDLSREKEQPIIIGSERMKYIRSIRVSQLLYTPQNKTGKEGLVMITKQSNNILPILHRLVTDEYGENYWFNGCAKYVMECQNEKDYDYWFFAGLTGDVFTQHYTYTKYSGDALSSYMMDENPAGFVEDTFAKCGYAATFVSEKDLRKNTEMYLQTLIAYIDKGIPVIKWDGMKLGVFVGYEDYGKVLLYITGNKNQPERITLDKALEVRENTDGWIFIGNKKESRTLAGIYREAICAIPKHQNVKTSTYCFGAEAFRKWARDIVMGKFDGMTVEEFDTWAYYTNYVCVLATNSGCCRGFLKKAQELNPDFTFLEDVGKQYRITGLLWNGHYDASDTFAAEYTKSHSDTVAANLEAIGGGFNITLKALQDKPQREKIAATILKCADCMDEVVRIINENIK